MHRRKEEKHTQIPLCGTLFGGHIDKIDNIKQEYTIKLGIFFEFLL